MYVSGDTVDFQFGSDATADPKRSEAIAGDFRVSIGNFHGQPAAVLYRKVSKEKKPKAFTSGVIAHYEMDFVAVIDTARIQAGPRRDGKGYAAEAVLPWAALGFKPAPDTKYRGDFGATHGDAASARTRMRTHWNNQETGLVDDAVFELKNDSAQLGRDRVPAMIHRGIPSRTNNRTHGGTDRRVLGRVGVSPAVLRVPRSTRRTSIEVATHNDVRKCSARRGTRRAGRPPYPRHAALLSVRLFARDGMGWPWLSLNLASLLSSSPWVPRGLVTHGYCCFGAARLMQHIVGLFRKDGNQFLSRPARVLHGERG